MTACPPSERLNQMLAADLTDTECVAIERHLDQCAACRDELHRLSESPATDRWRQLQARPPDLLPANLVDRVLIHSPATDSLADHLATMPQTPRTIAANAAGLPAVPGYEVAGELGRGGMGIVYRARHRGLNRSVVLKIILSGGHAGPEELARFQGEAESVALLEHPNIVKVFDYGTCELGTGQRCPYMALEFVEGGTLRDRLQTGPVAVREAATITAQMAEAMHVAHQRGIIHRDLKPANILLTADGTPKLSDFGLAKRMDVDSGVTQTGQIVGTPSYMAPEQAMGETRTLTTQVDVYGLGAVLYELLTGQAPFRGETVLATLLSVRNDPPKPPHLLDEKIDRDLETICLKCLEKDPANRYGSAAALAEDLRRWLAGEPIRVRPPTALVLIRSVVRQNFGAAVWTIPLGLLYGLIGAWQLFLANISTILYWRHHAYLDVPSVPEPWWSLPSRPAHWLAPVSFLMVFVATCSAGLATVLIVRPKNRLAELATGLLTGTTASVVLFLISGVWCYTNELTYHQTKKDLLLIMKSAEAHTAAGGPLAPDADPIVQAYPDLRDRSETERREVMLAKYYGDSQSRIPLAIFTALFMSLFIGEAVVLSGVLAAGHVMRRRKGWRLLLPYYGLAGPAVFIWGLLFQHVYLFVGGNEKWVAYAGVDSLIIVLLTVVIAAQVRGWPRWSVAALHVAWIAAIVVRHAVLLLR